MAIGRIGRVAAAAAAAGDGRESFAGAAAAHVMRIIVI